MRVWGRRMVDSFPRCALMHGPRGYVQSARELEADSACSGARPGGSTIPASGAVEWWVRFDPMAPLSELQAKWNHASRWYDYGVAVLELFVFRALRRKLLASAKGRVLEVAAGTGANLAWYPAGLRITAVDLSPGMLQRARHRGAADLSLMDAGRLALADASFDTVVSTLGTCTFPDPVAALREMRRVCRPGGRILLLEHGRSDRPRFAAYQDRTAASHARHLGCWWNRNPLHALREAGIEPTKATRRLFGTVHTIEARI
jgi:ubiquinone/menaquinone biosynthesis C-methylase UbiE